MSVPWNPPFPKSYNECTERDLANANSGEIEATIEDGVTPSYCPDTFDDGRVVVVDENASDIWVCATCGRVTDRCTNDSRGQWSLSHPTDEFDLSEWVVVRGRTVIDEIIPPVSIVDSPFAAKDDLKELPFRQTDRRWSDDLDSWVVATHSEEFLVAHMRERGWDVVNLARIVMDGGGQYD